MCQGQKSMYHSDKNGFGIRRKGTADAVPFLHSPVEKKYAAKAAHGACGE